MTEENHIALYRKYRPQSFSEVVGQKQVVEILEKSIKDGTVVHAYLFSGGRGTGKTTVARILAKEIGTTSKDLYEMDAASNRKIDDFRELNDSVHTLPFDSQYKVYIIDEVHMLTKDAFNAFLKTLEEPPKHVIFILATTEIDKLPDTIVSRCQSFVFSNPTRKELSRHVQAIAHKEGRELDNGASELIAMLADGSYRDGIGVLQKILACTEKKKVTHEDIESITEIPKQELLRTLLSAIDKNDIDGALEVIASAVETNVDFLVFQKMLIERVRAVILLRYSKSAEKYIKEQMSEENLIFLKQIAQNKDIHIHSRLLRALLDAYIDTRNAYIKQLPLELTLIDILKK